MRAVIQRVSQAQVKVNGAATGTIGPGLVVLLAVGQEDGDGDVAYLVEKIVGLRIFRDREGKMNLSLAQVGGQLLVISQFTLWGDCRKGRRPSFARAAAPDLAQSLYRRFLELAAATGIQVQAGVFGAMMELWLVNDGPVTLLLDSGRHF